MTRAVVSAADLVPVQLDGDPAGYVNGRAGSTWTAQVLPGAVDVLVSPRFG